jgi:hypothetical protein
VLPQVLAGLGLFSLLSAGCLLWLQRLEPVFFALAVGAVAYQFWLVSRRPPAMRTWGMKAILTASITVNLLLIGGWIALQIRYR